ncbi:MAG: hypothetical protein ABWZ85_10350 [Luteibacter sp.]
MREGNRLVRIELPTLAAANAQTVLAEEQAAWSFEYRQANAAIPIFLIRRLISPTGLVESITYDDAGLAMPGGAPYSHMPVVTRHHVTSLSDPATALGETHYRFSRTNFSGFDVVANWAAAHDGLIHLIGQGAFAYWVEETKYNGGKPAIVTRRDFNQFHLLTKQTTTRGKVTAEVTMEYGDLPGRPFAEQPANFQLPHRQVTRQWHADEPGVVLETYTETAYDDHGNVISQIDGATGIREVSEHYPAEGLKDERGDWLCPPDPLGIVRRLKSRTTTPGPGGGPHRSARYRYGDVPSRDGTRRYVQCFSEEEWVSDAQGDQRRSRIDRTYVTDRSLAHGCLAGSIQQQDWGTSETIIDYALGREGWTTRTTVRTPDGLEATSSETLALVNGLTLATENMVTRTEYGYDPLGRMVSETVSPGIEDYEATRTWAYLVSLNERWVESRDVLGVRRRSYLDERGLEVAGAEAAEEEPWFTMLRYDYDGLGQRVAETLHDELPGGNALDIVTRYAYDDWGSEARVFHPDGSISTSETQLVRGEDRDDVWLRTWTRREGGGLVEYSGRTDTDAAGRSISRVTGALEERWAYDGLGRIIEQSVAWEGQERRTLQAWDNDDRQVETTLPDGSRVRRTYVESPGAPRSERLDVTGPGNEGDFFLGVREFDGLGRITRERAGSLETTHAYTTGQLAPASTRRPAGTELVMAYDRRLGEKLLTTREGQDGPHIAHADYNRRTGLPAVLGAEAGTIHITADSRGRLTEQMVQPTEGATHHCSTVLSPAGRILGRVGQGGSARTCTYDVLGRLAEVVDADPRTTLAEVVDGDLRTTLDYDALSRLVRRTTESPGQGTLAQDTGYDEFGRVNDVAWSLGGSTVRRLVLVYRADSKVAAKQWYHADGSPCREESFDYDMRGRLITHAIESASDGELPADDEGKRFVRQVFTHDAIDNLLTVLTTRRDGTTDEMAYDYDAVDRDRAVRIRRTTAGQPGDTRWELRYDADGNLVDDGRGMRLSWDRAGRLASMSLPDGTQNRYEHGPGARPWIVDTGTTRSWRFYEDGALVYEYAMAGEARRFIRVGGKAIAETRLAQAVRTTWLLGTDPQGSVIVTDDGQTGIRTYDAFGVHRDGEAKAQHAGSQP